MLNLVPIAIRRDFLRWNRTCQAGQRHFTLSLAHMEQQAVRLRGLGLVQQAYRVGVAVERYAVRRGDQSRADRWRDFVTGISPEIGLAVASSSVAALEQAAQQAAAREQWGAAVAYVSEILVRKPRVTSVRRRAMVNRATGLHALGRLSDALGSYEDLQGDAAVWTGMAPTFQAGVALSGAVVQWYLGLPVGPHDLDEVTQRFSRAPFTWISYWWLLGHLAWERNPERLVGLRMSSMRTFEDEWGRDVDRALWGLDLLSAAGTPRESAMEQRIRGALNDPRTARAIGRIGWFDLYTDLLLFLELQHPREAIAEAHQLVAWCNDQGFDGWAAYWLDRLAHP